MRKIMKQKQENKNSIAKAVASSQMNIPKQNSELNQHFTHKMALSSSFVVVRID